MQTQTRVISKDFAEFVDEHYNDQDSLLETQELILAIIKKDAIEAMVHAEMEAIIRDCLIAKRKNLSYAVFLEKLIEQLATLFEEADDGEPV